MEHTARKKHWEEIYQSKKPSEVSWFEPLPITSLEFIKDSRIDYDSKIIDVGGGDSLLADHLLSIGYSNITVLDISETAIGRSRQRMGEKSALVKWIVSDIADFRATEKYDLWHDRAAFHFLTDEKEISQYVNIAWNSLSEHGTLVIGTFSDQGPTRCSGIAISQYDEIKMEQTFQGFFKKIKCTRVDHPTPSGATQNFLFCSFSKMNRF